MSDNLPKAPIANTAADELNSDIILINSSIMPRMEEALRRILGSREHKKPRVVVILVTAGGLADVAYRCARLLQDTYEHVTICISGYCKSAGTLIAIGAHELVMGSRGELGPLDVQIAAKDEIGNRNSGLTIDSAFEGLQRSAYAMFESFIFKLKNRSGGTVTLRTAADVASRMTIGMMAPIFEQIDPIRLGEDARSQKVGQFYAERLDMISDNLRPGALSVLLNFYPSHSFVIDRKEVKSLFKNVKPLESTLGLVVASIGRLGLYPGDDESSSVSFLNEVVPNEELGDVSGGADETLNASSVRTGGDQAENVPANLPSRPRRASPRRAKAAKT